MYVARLLNILIQVCNLMLQGVGCGNLTVLKTLYGLPISFSFAEMIQEGTPYASDNLVSGFLAFW